MGRADVASLVGTTMKRPKLLFFVTEDWVFCSHRLALGRAAVNAGYEVVLVTRLREHKKLIEDANQDDDRNEELTDRVYVEDVV